ncbi:MAG: hypothetical protein JJ900_16195 [Rhodospirillales bacterium]|nr:hypothetical protein [Rhodospirillales bacterium]MBO6788390.1 hypothetical protein [Rhodospirillales bacterium]
MATWVQVNGANVGKDFFDDNVREANTYDWRSIDANILHEHAHCMICSVAIAPNAQGAMPLYKSNGGHLCEYCHDHFVES